MVKVIKKGLETSVQDYPGRIGTLNLGFPSSGPRIVGLLDLQMFWLKINLELQP